VTEVDAVVVLMVMVDDVVMLMTDEGRDNVPWSTGPG
jgi:hypothetical protein